MQFSWPPISASFSATGLAQETTLQDVKSAADNIEAYTQDSAASLDTIKVIDFAKDATLAALSAKVPASLGQKTSAASLAVVLSSDQPAVKTAQDAPGYVDSLRSEYASVNVTTGAWTQVKASTAGAAKGILVFDSSGQTLELGFGAPGAEARRLIIPPGGLNGFIPFAIPAGTRLAVRALSALADVGELNITLLG